MELIDLILPPDPANDDVLAMYDRFARPERMGIYVVNETLKEANIIQRAHALMDVSSTDVLYDPVTGMQLELVEQNGLWIYVSPDNGNFCYELAV